MPCLLHSDPQQICWPSFLPEKQGDVRQQASSDQERVVGLNNVSVNNNRAKRENNNYLFVLFTGSTAQQGSRLVICFGLAKVGSS